KLSESQSQYSTFNTLSVYAYICLIRSCQAGEHYCPTGYTLEIDMTARRHQDERLIPRLIESGSSRNSSPASKCDWLLKVHQLTSHRQMVIQGLPPASADTESPAGSCQSTEGVADSMQYKVLQPNCSSRTDSTKPQNVPVGLFEVLNFTDRLSRVAVSFEKARSSSACNQAVIVRAVTPLTGFCSRDMLSFRGYCYAVSSAPQNMTVAVSSIRGDAQLASFSSMAEISEFIA
uniref:Tub domain-containing protein n=1 Tax=Macrostomum lignano TaxID=282301 RepID=A0A1I8GAY7_9PLAT